jgi:hypothetical protein
MCHRKNAGKLPPLVATFAGWINYSSHLNFLSYCSRRSPGYFQR